MPTATDDPTSSPWLLSPADLAVIFHTDGLLDALGCGDDLDPTDPAARALAAWLAEIRRGCAV